MKHENIVYHISCIDSILFEVKFVVSRLSEHGDQENHQMEEK